jgi:hypothetical protein
MFCFNSPADITSNYLAKHAAIPYGRFPHAQKKQKKLFPGIGINGASSHITLKGRIVKRANNAHLMLWARIICTKKHKGDSTDE